MAPGVAKMCGRTIQSYGPCRGPFATCLLGANGRNGKSLNPWSTLFPSGGYSFVRPPGFRVADKGEWALRWPQLPTRSVASCAKQPARQITRIGWPSGKPPAHTGGRKLSEHAFIPPSWEPPGRKKSGKRPPSGCPCRGPRRVRRKLRAWRLWARFRSGWLVARLSDPKLVPQAPPPLHRGFSPDEYPPCPSLWWGRFAPQARCSRFWMNCARLPLVQAAASLAAAFPPRGAARSVPGIFWRPAADQLRVGLREKRRANRLYAAGRPFPLIFPPPSVPFRTTSKTTAARPLFELRFVFFCLCVFFFVFFFFFLFFCFFFFFFFCSAIDCSSSAPASNPGWFSETE